MAAVIFPEGEPLVAYDPRFNSAWLKWGRAVLHGQTLQGHIVANANNRAANPVTTKTEYDAKRHGFRLIVTAIDPVPSSWALLLGDAASNYRGCLDHLAWALVQRGRTPPATLSDKRQRDIYFPICDSADAFRKATTRKLPGVRRADLNILRRYQPYKVGPTLRACHAIAALQGINDHDKHRTVRPLWAFPFACEFEIIQERHCEVTRIPTKWKTQLIDVNTELGCIYARKTGSQPYIEVKHYFALQPALAHRLAVHEWLKRICGNTGLLLKEFL